MSKMGEEYNKRLEKYALELLEACKGVLLISGELHTCGTSDPTGPCLGCDIEGIVNGAIAKVEKL